MTTQAKTRPVQFTYEDYLLFPEDGKRHELLEGEHCVTPSPNEKHQRVSGRLFVRLFNFLAIKPLGRVYQAPFDVVLSELDVVQPDILFISTPRVAIITERNVQGSPDLVVEIASEATRRTDEIVKRKTYERFDIPEYWVVDPEVETVKVYRMTGSGYARQAELSAERSDALSTPLLPGLSIPLKEIFEQPIRDNLFRRKK